MTLAKAITGQRFFSTVAVMNKNRYRLPPGHAYSFIGVCDIRKADNKVITLFAIRNPWGSESYGGLFNGTAADSNTAFWATKGASGRTYSQQCSQTNANDGLFYVTIPEYVELFYPLMAVAEWFPKWSHNYYAKEGATADSTEQYTMVNPTAQKAYVTFNLYPSRMFPVGCARNSAYYSIKIKQGSTQLSYKGAYVSNNLQINATTTMLAAGTYTVDIRVYGNPGANEIFDFTFKVYSEKGGVVIKDSKGKTNEVGVSDHTSCAKEEEEQ